MRKLNAVTLKDELWDTLLSIKNGSLEAAKGDAVASQAREILRTTNVQLKIMDKARMDISKELKEFSMSESQ